MSGENPKEDEEPEAPPTSEVEDSSLDQVAGGFAPCPEPPREKLTKISTIIEFNNNPIVPRSR